MAFIPLSQKEILEEFDKTLQELANNPPAIPGSLIDGLLVTYKQILMSEKKEKEPVYSTTPRKTGKGQWMVNLPPGYTMKEKEYHENMKKRALNPKDKVTTNAAEFIENNLKMRNLGGACCKNPNKQINTAGNTKFYVCKNCCADLGDV